MELVIHSGENSGTYTTNTISLGPKVIEISETFRTFTMPEHIENFTVLGSLITITP